MGRQTCLSASLQRRRQLQVHPGSAGKRQTGTHPDAAARGHLLPPRHPGGFRPTLLAASRRVPESERASSQTQNLSSQEEEDASGIFSIQVSLFFVLVF